MKRFEGILLIDNLIYGPITLIEDKENSVILEGYYDIAAKVFLEKYTRGIPLNLPYFTLELLFSNEGTPEGIVFTKDASIFEKSIVLEECIIDWPHVEVPLVVLRDDEPQTVRIPIIFRERIDHDHRPQRTNSPRLYP